MSVSAVTTSYSTFSPAFPLNSSPQPEPSAPPAPSTYWTSGFQATPLSHPCSPELGISEPLPPPVAPSWGQTCLNTSTQKITQQLFQELEGVASRYRDVPSQLVQRTPEAQGRFSERVERRETRRERHFYSPIPPVVPVVPVANVYTGPVVHHPQRETSRENDDKSLRIFIGIVAGVAAGIFAFILGKKKSEFDDAHDVKELSGKWRQNCQRELGLIGQQIEEGMVMPAERIAKRERNKKIETVVKLALALFASGLLIAGALTGSVPLMIGGAVIDGGLAIQQIFTWGYEGTSRRVKKMEAENRADADLIMRTKQSLETHYPDLFQRVVNS